MSPGSDGDLDRWAHAVLVAATGGTLAPPAWLARRIERGLGGVCLFGRNIAGAGPVARVRTLTDALRAVRPDVLVCTDEEGGDVTRLHAAFAPRAAAMVPRGGFVQWRDESEALARDRAYTGPALRATKAASDAPPMTPAYMAMLRTIAERRVIAAGVRMGAALQGLR